MLEELHVRDLALISEAWLELGPGLNVLTGETGAGKTVLVEALQLLVGERADSTLVRSGADEALVEGRFVVADTDRAARRRVTADGRSKCYLDDGMATVGELASALGSLVDLHGQHDHQALLRPSVHAGYLERFAGAEGIGARQTYADAFAAAVEARAERARVEADAAASAEKESHLTAVLDDITAIDPQPDEDNALEAELPRLRHGERLGAAAMEAYRALRSEEGGATEAIASAHAALRVAGGVDASLDALAEELDSIAVAADDLATRLRAYGEGVEYDPDRLNEIQARLSALDSLKRMHGPTLEDVLSTRDDAASSLSEIGACEDRLEGVAAAVAAADEDLRAAGERLVAVYGTTSQAFVDGLSLAAADLEMGASRFEVAVELLPFDSWTVESPARVEFLFSSSAGDAPRPLAKIGSGGEISRVMLALKSVLGEADATPVLVFDEVDTGIGGTTATAVGRRLLDLSIDRQVLVVTHLAQVAAFAQHHLVVSKQDRDGRAVTTVARVDGDERVSELARMLAGSDSEKGLAHARELLETAAMGA